MPNGRSSGLSVRRSSASFRRKFQWNGVLAFGNAVADGSKAIGILMNTSSTPRLVGSTIIRIHGEFSARTTVTGNMSTGAIVSAGLTLVSTDAAVVGGTALPSPYSDTDWSWLWHGEMFMQGAGSDSLTQMRVLPVDNKSMRKVQGNQSLVLVLENQANVSVDMGCVFRYLTKLP